VAKIIRGNSDYTEYTSLQYLAQHAPDLPVPKPHGLIKFCGVRVMFITYFPAMTLEDAWPNLEHESKVSIQNELNDIFTKLRTLRQPPGSLLGGVKGEGVWDYHWTEQSHSTHGIKTIEAFEDFRFTADSQPPNQAWINFLRSFLPPPSGDSVFTHGDVRTANIMVKQNDSVNYTVTGIIDWETSGFSPDYFESSKVLYLFDRNVQDDWYAYMPACIAPAKHPEWFLVGQIWDTSVGISGHCVEKY
jgi:aminoglycoside phosphotransferase (APT) family kinase protein